MIFSDRYTEIEKYSILRQEHICSSASMPWLYTGLVQDRYEPELSNPIKTRLNAALDFTPLVTEASESKRNDLKELTVDYVGDTHVGYITRFIRQLVDIKTHDKSCTYFKKQTRTTHLIKQYDDVFNSVNVIHNSPKIVGFMHDDEGVPSHIGIRSGKYDLSSYGDNAIRLGKYLEGLRNWSTPTIFFGEENLNIVINCEYAEWITESPGGYNNYAIKNNYEKKMRVGYDQISDRHIEALFKAELITEDQVEYVYSLLPGFDDPTTKDAYEVKEDRFGNQRVMQPWKYMLDFEYIIKDGVIDDIILHRYKYKKFKEIEVFEKGG